MVCSNSLPRIDPADALKTATVIFTEKSFFTEAALEARRENNLPVTPNHLPVNEALRTTLTAHAELVSFAVVELLLKYYHKPANVDAVASSLKVDGTSSDVQLLLELHFSRVAAGTLGSTPPPPPPLAAGSGGVLLNTPTPGPLDPDPQRQPSTCVTKAMLDCYRFEVARGLNQQVLAKGLAFNCLGTVTTEQLFLELSEDPRLQATLMRKPGNGKSREGPVTLVDGVHMKFCLKSYNMKEDVDYQKFIGANDRQRNPSATSATSTPTDIKLRDLTESQRTDRIKLNETKGCVVQVQEECKALKDQVNNLRILLQHQTQQMAMQQHLQQQQQMASFYASMMQHHPPQLQLSTPPAAPYYALPQPPHLQPPPQQQQHQLQHQHQQGSTTAGSTAVAQPTTPLHMQAPLHMNGMAFGGFPGMPAFPGYAGFPGFNPMAALTTPPLSVSPQLGPHLGPPVAMCPTNQLQGQQAVHQSRHSPGRPHVSLSTSPLRAGIAGGTEYYQMHSSTRTAHTTSLLSPRATTVTRHPQSTGIGTPARNLQSTLQQLIPQSSPSGSLLQQHSA
jgi:hypothetical protein